MVVTVTGDPAGRLRRAQVDVVGQTSLWNTIVGRTSGVGRYGNGSFDAALLRDALVGKALVGFVAEVGGLRGKDTLVGFGVGRVGRDASVVGTSVLIVTLGVGHTVRDNRTKISEDDLTSGRVARVLSTLGVGRKRVLGHGTASLWIASVAVALVGLSAISSGCDLTEGRADVVRVAKLTSIDGASVVVGAVGSSGSNGTLRWT